MRTESVPQERTFGLSADELAHWNENGYLVRLNVFTAEDEISSVCLMTEITV